MATEHGEPRVGGEAGEVPVVSQEGLERVLDLAVMHQKDIDGAKFFPHMQEEALSDWNRLRETLLEAQIRSMTEILDQVLPREEGSWRDVVRERSARVYEAMDQRTRVSGRAGSLALGGPATD